MALHHEGREGHEARSYSIFLSFVLFVAHYTASTLRASISPGSVGFNGANQAIIYDLGRPEGWGDGARATVSSFIDRLRGGGYNGI